MGLFDFVKDMGQKLFDRDGEAAESIQEHIMADNPGISNLQVSYDDGVVDLAGQATSREALEKVVLMAGNVKGVTEVRADAVTVPEPVEFYVIERGDTLSGIAKRYYGNAMRYPEIFEANREVIKDPDKIYPEQKIRIPLD